MKKYNFTYVEEFNNTELVKTSWESDIAADFFEMEKHFNRLISAIHREGLFAERIGQPLEVGEFVIDCCGMIANVGPAGDIIKKTLVMSYVKE